ncbi:MAG: hypothetical protein R3344_06355 [Acidobacteriota bacterium]|nr:hypothetical protein [Acidobacteriota bacterium]
MLTRSVSSTALRHLTLLSLALFSAAACIPSEAPEASAQAEMPSQTPRAAQEGLTTPASGAGSAVRVVYRDPATGELTSTRPEGVAPPEDPALAERGVGDFHRNVEVIYHENGMIEFRRPGGFRVKLVATLDEDGNLAVRHSTEPSPDGDADGEEVAHER